MTVWRHKRGGWYLAVRRPSRKRDQIYIGRMTKGAATWLDARVAELAMVRSTGIPMSPDTAAWIASLRGPLRDWLVKVGLADPPPAIEDLTLEQWFDRYLASRSDYAKGTLKGWKTARKHIVAAFGDAKLADITAFSAHTFARTMAQQASSEHASKIVERANQLFEAAIQAEMITKNPFSGVKIQAKRDKSRAFHIDSQTAKAVLAACPHIEAKTVFALARWCGLRVPHEPLALEWSHIDWDAGRIQIPAGTKTGPRVVPLFPEARDALRELRAACPLDQIHVIDRARKSAATTWRDWILLAIDRAGLAGWPKLFHNLRASCRTDLADRFEPHVCDAWIGHSNRVAKEHYLMVTADDWAAATKSHS